MIFYALSSQKVRTHASKLELGSRTNQRGILTSKNKKRCLHVLPLQKVRTPHTLRPELGSRTNQQEHLNI